MTITKTLLLAGLVASSFAGAAMAQNDDAGQAYWAEKALQARPAVGPVQGLSHTFLNQSTTINQAPDVVSVGGGEG